MIPDLPGWDSLPSVTRYHNWAEMAGIVAVAFLVIAEFVSYQYGQRKDALTEQQQTATNQRHDEDVARLHLETAQIQERAAQLEKEAESERVIRLQLERQVAPRRFGPENLKQGSQKLTGLSGQPAVVASYSLDLESAMYAGQIIECLRGGGLVVTDNRSSIMPLGGFSIGVHISGSDANAVEKVAKVLWAFSNAIVKIDAAPSPPQGQAGAVSPISILVGPKPLESPDGGVVVGPDDKVLIPPIGRTEIK